MQRRTWVLMVVGAWSLGACGSSGATETTGLPEPTDATSTNVGSWIAYQRFQDQPVRTLDIRLVRPDGSGDHPLLSSRPGDQTHPDWSPDGGRIVFTVDETQLWTTDVDGTNAAKLPIDCTSPCALLDSAAWSPDGRRIAYIREGYPEGQLPFNSIDVIDLDDDTVSTLYTPPPLQGADHPRWAPDGASIVFDLSRFANAEVSAPDGSAIAVLHLDQPSSEPELLTDWSMFAAYPDWNPVDDRIVMSTYDLGRRDGQGLADMTPPSDLYSVAADGSALTQLTHNPHGSTLIRGGTASGPLSTQPSWSPDGTSIIFVQVDGTEWPGWSMATASADGTDVHSATGSTPMVGTHPRLRPIP